MADVLMMVPASWTSMLISARIASSEKVRAAGATALAAGVAATRTRSAEKMRRRRRVVKRCMLASSGYLWVSCSVVSVAVCGSRWCVRSQVGGKRRVICRFLHRI